jgi:SSS family solute:Na+ symporter
MAITLGIVFALGIFVTVIKPLREPVVMPVNEDMDLTSSPIAKKAGIGVVILTVILYIIFW